MHSRRTRDSELSGSDPEAQRQQMLAAGVVLSHIYQAVGVSGTPGTNSRRAWHSLNSRLGQDGTLVVVSIDRIGLRWLDTMGNIHDLQRRGVRIRSLAENEQSWTQYLDAAPESPESFLGYTLAALPPGCPTRNWCPSDAVPRLVWRRRRRAAGNWKLPAVVGGAGGHGYRDGGRRSQPAGSRQVLRRILCDGQGRRTA